MRARRFGRACPSWAGHYADRTGEKPRFTVEPAVAVDLDRLATDAATSRPITERQMLALRHSIFGPMRVGGAVIPFGANERVCGAKGALVNAEPSHTGRGQGTVPAL